MITPPHTKPVLAIFWDDGNISHRRRRMVFKRLKRYGCIGSVTVFFRDSSTNKDKWPDQLSDINVEKITVPTIKAGDSVDDVRMGGEIMARLSHLRAAAVVIVSNDKIFYGVVPVIIASGKLVIGVVKEKTNPVYAGSFDLLLRIVKRKKSFGLEAPYDDEEFITRLIAKQLSLPHWDPLSSDARSPLL